MHITQHTEPLFFTRFGTPLQKSLTDLSLKKLKPQEARYDVWDTKISNLGVRVFPSGVKSFFLSYRLHNKRRRDTIGRYPEFTLSDARQVALERKSQLAKGNDPKTTNGFASTTFADTLTQFLDLHCARFNKPSTQNSTRKLLENNCLPRWSSMPVDQITRGHVLVVLDDMVARGSGGAANRCYSATSKFFNWCISRGLIESNPCASIQRPSKEHTRDRVLTDDEIKSIWEVTIVYPFDTIVRFLLLTACRRSEISGMRWDWVSDDTLTIPAEHTKNGAEHTLPITPLVREALDTIPTSEGFLFPARGRPHNSFSGFGKCKERLDKKLSIAPWTLHDLRRTAATHMAQMGVLPHIIERVLNHSSGTISGVAAVYNRFHYQDDTKAALLLWHDKIKSL